MNKNKKRRNRNKQPVDKEFSRRREVTLQSDPILFPTTKEEPLMQKLIEAERAYLEPEKWGIDLRPVFEKVLDPPPSPDDLSDQEVAVILRSMIDLLAQYHLGLEWTNHMTDRQLYTHILEEVVTKPLGISSNPVGDMIHHECCPCECSEVWYRYYADEDEREQWQEFFDDEPLPEKAPLVSDRDEEIRALAESYRMQSLPGYHKAAAT